MNNETYYKCLNHEACGKFVTKRGTLCPACKEEARALDSNVAAILKEENEGRYYLSQLGKGRRRRR